MRPIPIFLLGLAMAGPVPSLAQDTVQVADTVAPPPTLPEAARAGDGPTVLRLLEEGADPNQPDRNGDLALGLHLQGFGDPFTVAGALLGAGADPNRPNRSGTTPLMFASQWAPPELVQMLLEAGGDPNRGDGAGDVPLGSYIANHDNPVAIARVLLAAGADPARPNASGVTPRMYAEHWGPPELVRLLSGG